MSLKIDRFQVIDVENKGLNWKGIKDHSTDKLVVLLNDIVDEQTTVSIAEVFISVIENHLQQEEVDDNDNQAEP